MKLLFDNRKSLLIFYFLLSTTFCFTQNFIKLSGKVFDYKTNDPISCANIFVMGQAIGTNTNTSGEFIFNVPIKNKFDTIVVSSLGYESFKCLINDFSNKIIYLKPYVYNLQEITIKNIFLKPKQILNNVKKHYDDNYVTTPYIASAFYRQYLEDDTVFNSALEAALSVYNNGDGKKKYYPTKIDGIKFQKSKEVKINISMLNFIYKMNWTTKTLFIENFRKWTFSVDTIEYFDNNGVYVLKGYRSSSSVSEHYIDSTKTDIEDIDEVSKHENNKNICSNQGSPMEFVEIQIDAKDFAIIYFSHEYKDVTKKIFTNFSTTFEKINNKYYPKYCRFYDENNLSKTLFTTKEYNAPFNKIYVYMNINNINMDNVKEFNDDDCINIFHFERYSANPAFWENYNYITNDKLREKVFKDLINE